MKLLLAGCIAYLIGAIPLSRDLKVFDYTDHTAFRTFRISELLIFFILTLFKGALAVIIAWAIAGTVAAHLAIILAVVGELYPCFPSSRSRNGWAVAAGGLLVVSPIVILISFGVYLLTLLLTRTFFASFILSLIVFIICAIFFAMQISLWILVLGLIVLLLFPRSKWRKGWRIKRW